MLRFDERVHLPKNRENTITFLVNGEPIGTVETLAPGAKTVDIPVPTVDYDSVTDALGYVPYNSTNPNNYITSSALNGYATETWVGQQGYVKTNQIPTAILEMLYPVGSIYIGTMSVCPLQTLGVGTWQLVATDRVLQGAGTRGSVGTTVNESLPNITGNFGANFIQGNFFNKGEGAFGSYRDNSTNPNVPYDTTAQYPNNNMWDFDASRSSSTYQNNAPVQQDAYLVNIWERIS